MTAVLTFLVSTYAVFTLIMLVARFERGLLLLIPIVPIAAYTYRTPITGLNQINVLIYTAFALGLFRRLRQGGPLPPATWPIITFFCLTIFSWLIGWLNYRNDSLYPFDTWREFINVERWIVYTLLYFAYFFGWSTRIPVRQAFVWMLAGVFIVAAYNVIEAVRPGAYLISSGRAGGIFTQANSNGIFLASYGLLPVIFASTSRSAGRRALYWGIFALEIYGIFLSGSRTALICMVSVLLVFAFYRSRRAFAGMVVLLCLVVPLAPLLLPKDLLERYESTLGGSDYEGVAGKFEPSTANRIVQNQAGLKLFMDSPIIGHGFEGFFYRSPKYLPPGAPGITRAAHSSFLMLGVGGGIMSLAAFLWLLANLGMAGKRLHEDGSDEETRLLGLFLLATLVSKILANFASTEFMTGDATSYVWISAALVSRLQGDISSRAPSAVRQETRSTWRSRSVTGARPPVMHG